MNPIRRQIVQTYQDGYQPIIRIEDEFSIYAIVYMKRETIHNDILKYTNDYYHFRLEYSNLHFHGLTSQQKTNIEWLFDNIVNTFAYDLSQVNNYSTLPDRINSILPTQFKIKLYEN